MAPAVRDIRSFFKPGGQSAQNDPPRRDSNPSARRTWPSPRTHTLCADASTDGVAPSTTPSVVPAKRPAVEEKQPPKQSNTENRPPTTSQSSTNSGGSKKVTLNGQQMVLNSDSDSESDVLEELDFGVAKSPPHQKTMAGPDINGNAANRPATRASQVKAAMLPTPATKTAPKPSLGHLVQLARKDAEMEQRIASRKADLDKPVEETPQLDPLIDEEALASVINDDGTEDKAKRLYLAMQRTNARDRDHVFHFLREEVDTQAHRTSPFPAESLPRHGWATNFDDPWHREQAFLTGFAQHVFQHVFQHQTLPEELARWIIDQICLSQSDSLSAKYIELIRMHPHHLQTILDETQINSFLIDAGADVQCFKRPVTPSYELLYCPKRPINPSLKWLIELLRIAAPHLHANARKHSLVTLWHFCIDDSVLSDAATLSSVQQAIEATMAKTTDLSSTLHVLLPGFVSRIQDPVLQNKLILALPSRSAMAASFRQYLALTFLVYPNSLDIPPSSPGFASLLDNHLDTSPGFNITRDTDYSLLAARLSLLDVAIGPGPTAVPDPRPPRPSFSDAESPTNRTPFSLSSEEIAFNKEVDTLVKHIRMLANKIVKAGSLSSLTILDAKDHSERLCQRLESAVRIGGRKRENIFADEQITQAESKRVFGKWLGKKSDSRSATPSLNGDSGSLQSENHAFDVQRKEIETAMKSEDDAVVVKPGDIANTSMET